MWIILWIIQSFLNATGMILNKKVSENQTLWNNWQILISRWSHTIFLIFIFLIFGIFFGVDTLKLDIDSSVFTINNILLFLLATIWIYITYPLRRVAYANEKVSILQPFAMLYQIFPIILGFIFIASERANVITFISAVIASFVVIIPNIDFKKIEINKYSLMVLTSSLIKSAQIFAVLYLITILKPSNFYLIESVLIVMISLSLILLKKEFWEVKKITRNFWILLLKANFIVILSSLIVLTMFSSFWIIMTSLLSLLYLVFIYSLSYIFLWDKPSRKDIIITILVSICIIVWMLFKN